MSEYLRPVNLGVDVGSHALEIDVVGRRDECVLALAGDADLATATLLDVVLQLVCADPRPSTVVLEVRQLASLSACCVGLIAGAHARLRDEGRRLVVRAPSGIVRRMLEILGLGSAIEARHEDQPIELTNLRDRAPATAAARAAAPALVVL